MNEIIKTNVFIVTNNTKAPKVEIPSLLALLIVHSPEAATIKFGVYPSNFFYIYKRKNKMCVRVYSCVSYTSLPKYFWQI